VHPAVEAEIKEAARRYDKGRPGLGGQFIDAVREGTRGAERNPLRYAIRFADIRRCPTGVIKHLHQAEVGHLQNPVFSYQTVARLDVTVRNNSVQQDMPHAVTKLKGKTDYLPDILGQLRLPNPSRQVAAGNVIQKQKGLVYLRDRFSVNIVGNAEIDHRAGTNDIWVGVNLHPGQGFLLETFREDTNVIVTEPLKGFHGQAAFLNLVEDDVNDAHAPFENLEDFPPVLVVIVLYPVARLPVGGPIPHI